MLDHLSFRSIKHPKLFSGRGRRHSRLFGAVLVCAAVFVFSVPAQKEVRTVAINSDNLTLPVEYTAPTASYGPSTTFTVPITVNDITGDGIIAYQFDVVYDPAVINPTGANAGCSTVGTISGMVGTNVLCNVSPVGRLNLSSLGFLPIEGMGTLVNLTFTVSPTAIMGEQSPLTFENGFFFDDMGQVASNPNDGLITVLGPTSANTVLSGRVLTAGGRGIKQAVLTLTDFAGNTRVMLTNPFGNYRFNVAIGETYTLRVFSKGNNFKQAERIITVVDQLDNIDFVTAN
jgi:hypothetical protein